jgi:hypothetical protein
MTSFQQSSHPKLTCNYCGKPGHASEVCYKKEEDERKGNNSNRSNRSTGSSQGWFSENPRSGTSGFQYDMERSAWDQNY